VEIHGENKIGIPDWNPTYGIEIPSLDFKSFLSPADEKTHYALMNLLQIPEKEFQKRSEVFEIMAKWGKLRLSDALRCMPERTSLEEFCKLEGLDCWDEEEPVVFMLEGMHGMTEVGIVCINCE